jgi:hypothetical protein
MKKKVVRKCFAELNKIKQMSKAINELYIDKLFYLIRKKQKNQK